MATDRWTVTEPRAYLEYVSALQEKYPALAAAFTRDSIEYVLDWMAKRGLPPGSTDIVGQDEFSYDFLIRLEPEGKWLVFGVN